MSRIRAKIALLAATALLVAPASADDATADGLDLLHAAQEQMQATFTNLTINSFEPSPLPNVFQADVGGRIVYYSADPELLIFGQIFDRAGVDLTSMAMQAASRTKLANIDLDEALSLGDPDGIEIIEFTNPDCPYCRSLHRFFEVKATEGVRIHRRIVFAVSAETSRLKAEHVLCSDDKSQALNEVMNGGASSLKSCSRGAALVEAHARMSAEVGVNGTPTLFLDGRPVIGFRAGEITAFLSEMEQK